MAFTFNRYSKKYQMGKKEAEAALQDILAASGQDDIARRSHSAFHQKKGSRRKIWTLTGVLAAALALAGLALWQR